LGGVGVLNIRLTLEYDGTDFCGWQVQPGLRTVQGVLEAAILQLVGEAVSVTGSGRTDSGVHACGQVANFHTTVTIPPDRFKPALNGILPADVKVRESNCVPDDFHSRHSAKWKTYAYHFRLLDYPSPLERHRVWHVRSQVDFGKMNAALEGLVGTHDFAAFSSTGSSVSSTVRTISAACLTAGEREGAAAITLRGNGFLYNMVRIIAGGAVAIGAGFIPEDSFQKALQSGDRTLLHITAPAHGLYLMRVEY
jgi:tRNA pseudouridine38-40 synthase